MMMLTLAGRILSPTGYSETDEPYDWSVGQIAGCSASSEQQLSSHMASVKDNNTRSTVRTNSGAVAAPPAVESSSSRLTFHPLTYREMRRRFWHMAPGLLALPLQVIPHRDPLAPLLFWLIIGIVTSIALKIFLGFRQIQRQGETDAAASVAGYSMSVLLTILLLPKHLEVGLSVLSILAFGDGSATLFGLMFRGPTLPWNKAKSWSGFIAFITVGTLMTAWIFSGESQNAEAVEPPVSFSMAIALTLPSVLACAVVESVRSRINDNIRVGVVAAISLALLNLLRPL